jgi:hypothetical protein
MFHTASKGNPGPSGMESHAPCSGASKTVARTNKVTLAAELWSWRRDLNPRPSDYKSDALPAELRQPKTATLGDRSGMQQAPEKFIHTSHETTTW